MALINCQECNKQVSDKAASCPHCGAPINSKVSNRSERVKTSEDNALTRNRGCGDIIIFGPLLLILIIVLLFFLGR